MLENLPKKHNITVRQLILNDVKNPKVDLSTIKSLFVTLDQRLHNVASDVF